MTDVPPQEPLPSNTNPVAPPDDTERAEHTRPVLQPPPTRQAAGPERTARPRQSSSKAAARRRSPAARRGYPPAGAAPPPPTYSASAQQPQPYAPPRPARQRRVVRPSESGLYLPWWSLAIMVLLVGGVAFGLVLAFDTLSEPQTPGDQPPRIQVITSQPTLSQDFTGGESASQPGLWPTAIPQVQPEATVPLPTPVPSPSLPPGDMMIGARVKVVGVGANGLNVRSAPGLYGTPLFLAREDEVFAIVDGPQSADGLEWWKLEDAYDPSRTGWAARNYLMVVSP